MLQRFNAGCARAFIRDARAVPARGVFAEIVNDSPGGGQRLRMLVETEAREFGDAKLFAQDALRVVSLKNPVFQASFHATDAFEERTLGRLVKRLGPRNQRLLRLQPLQTDVTVDLIA